MYRGIETLTHKITYVEKGQTKVELLNNPEWFVEKFGKRIEIVSIEKGKFFRKVNY